MLTPRVPILQRAFEIAQSGKCKSVKDLRTQLKADGYMNVKDYIAGKALTGQLKRLCTAP